MAVVLDRGDETVVELRMIDCDAYERGNVFAEFFGDDDRGIAFDNARVFKFFDAFDNGGRGQLNLDRKSVV